MKEKNELFLALYRAKWDGVRWGSSLFRRAFNSDHRSNLPRNLQTIKACVQSECENYVVTLILKPINMFKVRKHRVFVFCGKCNQEVPAGRIHQHKC